MTSADPKSDTSVKTAIRNVEFNIEKLDNQLQTFIAHRHLLETCKLDYSFGGDTGGNEVLLAQIHRLQSENQEILETLKIKCETLEVYRTKYLVLVGVVEEQRTEIGKIKFESKSVLDKITGGFRTAIDQLTEQFQAFEQLPKILKDTHNECAETKQKLLITEQALESMSRDLVTCICQNEQLKDNVQKQGLVIQLSNEKCELNNFKDDSETKNWFLLLVSTVLPDYEELQSKHRNLEQLVSENEAKDEAIKDLKKQLEILKDKTSDYVRRT
jgi:hypothetical protein